MSRYVALFSAPLKTVKSPHGNSFFFQGGRKRKQAAPTGNDPLFLQHGSGRALRRRTVKSDDPACGALAQTAHNLEHGENQPNGGTSIGLISETHEGEAGGEEEAGVLGTDEEIKSGAEVGLEVGLAAGLEAGLRGHLNDGSVGGDALFDGGLKIVREEGGLTIEETGGALLEEEHWGWEEGAALTNPTTGFSGPGTPGWSGQVAFDTGEEDEAGLAKPRSKPALRRATARDKEFAALVHKVHLLCLLGRGICFDTACDDPLLQASLLSCAPEAFGNVTERGDVMTGTELGPLVEWFQVKFRVGERAGGGGSGGGVELSGLKSDAERFLQVLERGVGTSEEVAALFVALCRALGLTTR
jgi:hypothetical protein